MIRAILSQRGLYRSPEFCHAARGDEPVSPAGKKAMPDSLHLSRIVSILQLPQRRAIKLRGLRPKAKSGRRVPLARCAAVIPPPPLPAGRSSWQGGSFAPRCIPRTRSVAPWTSPDALRLLDFRPGRFHQPLDPRPWGDFALPPDPHRPGVCRHGPAAGLSRPCTTNRAACRPGAPAQPWADWICAPDLRPQEAIGAAQPRRGKS
jgi:hypothetical protein